MRNAAPGRAALMGASDPAGQIFSQQAAQNQEQPLERHEPLADDKRVWFELARIHLLAGRWQGPGTIAQLRLAERWRL